MRLPSFALERYFSRHEFNVELLLCGSDCESMSVRDLLEMEPGAREKLHRHWLGYTESQGSPSLRNEICRLYGTVESGHVLVHSGAEEAVFLFMHAMLDRGDHLVVHWPCYQSLHEVARGIGCRVTPWMAREEDGWALDVEELRRALRGNTKAIVINTPHNPTGYRMPLETFRETIRIADENGIILFSDEVYRGLEYRSADRLPAACDMSEQAVSLGVMSKTYGLAGLRIGWIATRRGEVLSRMAALKDYTTICNSAPSELLAEVALRHGDAIAERNRGIIAGNLALLDGFFERHADSFSWQRPKAGPIAFPRLLCGEVDAFCGSLVKASGVLLLPGTVYEDRENHFRIGFGRRSMPDAVARLEEFLRDRPVAR